MLALYRAGRQAEALEAYQEARRVLMDELGLEPSEELRALQQAILQQDASLGASSEGVATRGPDRRTVTVLFCDLVDSTRLATELDPEVYRGLISRYFDVARRPIERHGGTVEKFIGDAVMAVFGVPDLHEDDALRAVRAAREVQDALRDLSIEARIGISTGEVHVLSAPGEDLHVSGAAAGAASQLEGRAPAGGVLLDDETHRLVRDAVRAEQIGDAWKLDEVLADAPAYARRLDAPLVGREEELQRLATRTRTHARIGIAASSPSSARRASARRGSAASSSRRFVKKRRCSLDAASPTARAPPTSRSQRSSGKRQRNRHSTGSARFSRARKMRTRSHSESRSSSGSRNLQPLPARRSGPCAGCSSRSRARGPSWSHSTTSTGRSRRSSTSWNTSASGRRDRSSSLCLARGDLLDARPGWGGPTSTGFLVRLEPLPEETLGALVEQLAGEPVDPEIQERIIEQSGGNPLFAEQLLALVQEAPELALDKTPATVEALLASRLDRLDPASSA